MHRILAVARREYLATVVTKGFIISLVILPVLMLIGALVPKFVKERSESGENRLVVLGASPELFAALQREDSQVGRIARGGDEHVHQCRGCTNNRRNGIVTRQSAFQRHLLSR